MKSKIQLMLDFCEKFPTLHGVDYLNYARALAKEEKEEGLANFIHNTVSEIMRGWPDVANTHIDLGVLAQIWFSRNDNPRADCVAKGIESMTTEQPSAHKEAE